MDFHIKWYTEDGVVYYRLEKVKHDLEEYFYLNKRCTVYSIKWQRGCIVLREVMEIGDMAHLKKSWKFKPQ